MITATADTNIYISALQFGGTPQQFLNLARAGVFQLVISGPLLDEMSEVLSFKFGWTASMLNEAVGRLSRFTVQVFPTETLHVVKADPTMTVYWNVLLLQVLNSS